MAATCKDCKKTIVWAAHEGRMLPFETTTYGPGAVSIYKHSGTYCTGTHRGHPHVQAYRRHQCRKRRSK